MAPIANSLILDFFSMNNLEKNVKRNGISYKDSTLLFPVTYLVTSFRKNITDNDAYL